MITSIARGKGLTTSTGHLIRNRKAGPGGTSCFGKKKGAFLTEFSVNDSRIFLFSGESQPELLYCCVYDLMNIFQGLALGARAPLCRIRKNVIARATCSGLFNAAREVFPGSVCMSCVYYCGTTRDTGRGKS